MIHVKRQFVRLLFGISTIGTAAGAQAFTLPVLDPVAVSASCTWTAADATLARRGIARIGRVQTGEPLGLSRLIAVYLNSTRGLQRMQTMTLHLDGTTTTEEGATAEFGPSGKVSRGSRQFITRDVKDGTGQSRTIHLLATDSVRLRSLAETVMKLCGV